LPGWDVLPVAALEDERVRTCVSYAKERFEVTDEGGRVSVRPLQGGQGERSWPPQLECIRPLLQSGWQLGGGFAWLGAIEQTPTGWLVGTSAGEWSGGGLYWIDQTGRAARRIRAAELPGADFAMHNVLGVERSGDGWLVFLERRLLHFDLRSGTPSAQVVAPLGGWPLARTRANSGGWLVVVEGEVAKETTATSQIVAVSPAGTTTPIAAVGEMADFVSSIRQESEGSIWLGARSGVVRLTQVWSEPPRYWPTYLVPHGSTVFAAAHTDEICAPLEVPREERRHFIATYRARVEAERRRAEAQWTEQQRHRQALGCAPVQRLDASR
jgi:hypothetical protein